MARAAKPKQSQRLKAAVVCTPGLEAVCVGEMKALGLKPKPAGPGTIEFAATHRQIYSANVWLRTASRIVVRVAQFRATDFPHLEQHAAEIDWRQWVPQGFAPAFRISSNESKLYHTKAIAQRLHRVGIPPSVGEPEQLFVVRIDRNNVTISVDSSGEALHKRAWRTELGRAPLRSTMAAAMIAASGRDPQTPLVDPFCGAGTIAIEAALAAAGLPSGGDRDFAFQQWPDFEPGAWASVNGTVVAAYDKSRGKAAATEKSADDRSALITATDRDDDMIESARRNAERAGVANLIRFERRVVAHTRAQPGAGLLISNPPYGRRMGRDELVGLYRRLGAVARERLPGFAVSILTPDSKLARSADADLRSIARFRHGGLPVDLFHKPAGPAPAPDAEVAEVAETNDGEEVAEIDLTGPTSVSLVD